jgi:hypothetical protein
VPYEQNTQQSPGFGRNRTAQPLQSKKYKHASVGMHSIDACPHSGHVKSEFVSTAEIISV